jgi:hypothetical protein
MSSIGEASKISQSIANPVWISLPVFGHLMRMRFTLTSKSTEPFSRCKEGSEMVSTLVPGLVERLSLSRLPNALNLRPHLHDFVA